MENKEENKEKGTLRIGVDFGGVLSDDALYDKESTNPEMSMPGCQEALKTLRSQGHYIVLVSFCGRNRANRNREVIPLDEFFDEFYFVKRREYKNAICKARGLDILIDDREDILDTLETCRGVLYGKRTASRLSVENWKDVLELIPKLKPTGIKPDENIEIRKLIY